MRLVKAPLFIGAYELCCRELSAHEKIDAIRDDMGFAGCAYVVGLLSAPLRALPMI